MILSYEEISYLFIYFLLSFDKTSAFLTIVIIITNVIIRNKDIVSISKCNVNDFR